MVSLWQSFTRSLPTNMQFSSIRLSAEDREKFNLTALYEGKAGLESIIAKYPGLDLKAEQDAFTRALHAGIERDFGQDKDTVQYIIDQGADTNKADPAYGSMLPLGRACARAKGTDVFENLIAGHAEIDKVDADGKSPIMHALDTDRKSDEKVALLVKNGLDINASKGGQLTTPLGYAARLGNVKKGQKLVQHGAVKRITDDSNAPRQYSVERSSSSFQLQLCRIPFKRRA